MSEIKDRKELEAIAAALYDGGWRSGDIYELVTEYGVSEETADLLAIEFLMYETEGRELNVTAPDDTM